MRSDNNREKLTREEFPRADLSCDSLAREDLLFRIVGPKDGSIAAVGMDDPNRRNGLSAVRRILPKEFPVLSALVLLVILLGCLLCNLFIGGDPFRMDPTQLSLAPSAEHPFGTDTLGRDIWSIIWFGGRKSLFIGLLATLISTGIAVIYGTISGLASNTVDSIMMRFTEILLSIPSLLLIIFLQAVVGHRNVAGIAIIIGITGWMSIAKMVRTEVRIIRNSEFVLISRMMGGGFFHVLRCHLAPNFIIAEFYAIFKFSTAFIAKLNHEFTNHYPLIVIITVIIAIVVIRFIVITHTTSIGHI